VHVLLAAGGTAGHIEPALNLADALCRLDPTTRITVLGGERGLEATLVPARGYVLVTVPSVPMPRRPGRDLLALGPRVRRTVDRAARLVVDEQVDVIVGFGGYAAVPAYLAARRTRTPLVIHEANARAGWANRLGARFTSHVFATFPAVLPGARPMALPLRHSIATLDRAALRSVAREEFGLAPHAPVLLAFGGSQGAQRLNATVSLALPDLRARGVQVLHSYGLRNEAPVAAPGYVPVPFIERMDLAYAAADVALTRAGAMTCAELAAVGLPGLYVPLPIGNGEQRLNALPVVQAGGGLIIDDAALSPEWLVDSVASVLHDEGTLAAMGAAAAGLGVRDADERLARAVADAVAGGATRG
jgi:UDP-N-acetylglucosamine--N-acetylmuramyl-(pentapeptide) pyrophosphoryl-undecaprenol N-acetylglucosamine transferase